MATCPPRLPPWSLVLSLLPVLASAPPLAAQRVTRLTSAPRIGGTMNVTYAGSAGDSYIMFLARPSNTSIGGLPGIGGTLLIDPFSLLLLYTGGVPAPGEHTVGLPVPNDRLLVGFGHDFQPVNITPALAVDMGLNKARSSYCEGIGTVLTVAGTDLTATAGDLEIRTVSNANMGNPAATGFPAGAFQPIHHLGDSGIVEGYTAANQLQGMSDIDVLRRDRVCRNLVTPALQTLALPNGRDLGILRHRANDRMFSLFTLRRDTGALELIPATTIVDTNVTAVPASDYQAQVACSQSGDVAALIVKDSTNAAQTTVPDRVWLVRTNGTNWTTGLPVVDVSPFSPLVQRWTAGTLIVANGTVFANAGSWYSARLDGTPLSIQSFPATGFGSNPTTFSAGHWRMSRDRRTLIMAAGNTSSEMDMFAMTNINNGSYGMVNVSGFPTRTAVISAFGQSSDGNASCRAALTPDGQWCAFVSGSGNTTSPHRLWVAPTNGSAAGTLQPVNDATTFAAQVVAIGNVHFVSNTKLVFTAGSSTSATDVYGYDLAAAPGSRVSILTRTTTGSRVPPFTTGGNTGNVNWLGGFAALNGRWFYFVRGMSAQVNPFRNNIVGIDTTNFALKDITGTEFSAGTAPTIYRGGSAFSATPRASAEFSLRRSPATASNDAFFVAEPSPGGTSATFRDQNVFRFDIENGGQAVQLTNNTGSGALTAVRTIENLTVSPDGQWVAWSQRVGQTAATSEDVIVVSAAGGAPRQLSVTRTTGQTITDGSVHFVGSPIDAVVWSVGTGSLGVPTAEAVVQWSPIIGGNGPMDLSPFPVATPAAAWLVIGTLTANP